MDQHSLDASETASVVLDIGADVGALILYVPPAHLGKEIEISPVGTPNHRTHAAVRERFVESGSVYCLVYTGLVEGDYTIWGSSAIPAGSVRVTGAEVTELDWTDRAAL